ncbi:helix-turn-helix domain-containing protein [Streptomyces sp. NPDC006906]|uniref:helix-turn-helix transcriptional regulator n=2 Tax=Streptomyces TaxID=1883 RepID=UPI00340AD416
MHSWGLRDKECRVVEKISPRRMLAEGSTRARRTLSEDSPVSFESSRESQAFRRKTLFLVQPEFNENVPCITAAEYRSRGSFLPASNRSGVPMRRTTARAEESASGAGDRCPLMSAEELADFLGVPLNTVYIWNHRHQGPRAHKVGRYLRYRWPEVEAWLEAQAVNRAT